MAIKVNNQVVVDDSSNWSGSLISSDKTTLSSRVGGTHLDLKFIGNEFVYSKDSSYITAGAGTQINSLDIKQISDSKAIIAYRDYDAATNAYFGKVRLVTISGTNITYGNAVTFESANVNYISIDFITSTQGLIAYIDADNLVGSPAGGTPTLCPIKIENDIITVGTPVVVENTRADFTKVLKIDSTRWLYNYRSFGLSGSAADPSSRVVSFNSFNSVTINSGYGSGLLFGQRDPAYGVISQTRSVLVGYDGNNTIMRLLNISNTNLLTQVTSSAVFGPIHNPVDIVSLSPTSFLYVYSVAGATGTPLVQTDARVAIISTANDQFSIANSISYETSTFGVKTSLLNSNLAAISYTSSANKGTVKLIGITSSSNLQVNSTFTYNENSCIGQALPLNSSNFLVSYTDILNANNGISRLFLPYNRYQLSATDDQVQRVTTDANNWTILLPESNGYAERYNNYSIINKSQKSLRIGAYNSGSIYSPSLEFNYGGFHKLQGGNNGPLFLMSSNYNKPILYTNDGYNWNRVKTDSIALRKIFTNSNTSLIQGLSTDNRITTLVNTNNSYSNTFIQYQVLPVPSNTGGMTSANGRFYLLSGYWTVGSNVSGRSEDGGNTFVYFNNPIYGSSGAMVYTGNTYIWSIGLNGNSTYSQYALTSTDGVNWTIRTMSAGGYGQAIASDGIANTLISFRSSSGNGTLNYLMRSTDYGATWATITLPTTSGWGCVGYGNNVFVALPTGTSGSQVGITANAAYSTDGGNTWTTMLMPAVGDEWGWATYNANSNGANKWLAVRFRGNAGAVSSNGIVWTANTLPASPAGWTSVFVANSSWILIPSSSTTYYRSANAEIWETRTLPYAVSGGAWDANTNTIVLTVANSKDYLVSKDEGITWRSNSLYYRSTVPDMDFIDNKYIRLNNGLSNTIFENSNDVFNTSSWSTVNIGENRYWNKINDAGNVAYITDTSNTYSTVIRRRGSNTDIIPMPSSQKWSKFIKGDNASNTYIALIDETVETSTYAYSIAGGASVGNTWISGTFPVSAYWKNVVYANNQFIVVSTDGKYILTSVNGINWATQTKALNENVYDLGKIGNKAIALANDSIAVFPYSTENEWFSTQADINHNETAICSLMNSSTNDWSVSVITPKAFSYVGNRSIYHNNTTPASKIRKIDNDRILVAYADNALLGKTAILQIQDNAIIVSQNVVFNNANTYDLAVEVLDYEKALVAYRNEANANYGTVYSLNISSNTVSLGANSVFNDGSTDNIAIAKYTNSRAVVAYRDVANSNVGSARTLIMSGNTNNVSIGPEAVFKSANTTNISLISLSATTVLVAYRDEIGSNGNTRIMTISGNTITTGAEATFNVGNTSNISLAYISPTKAVVAYRDEANSDVGTACVLNISGTTVSPQSEVVFNAANTTSISTTLVYPNLVGVSYRDGGASNTGVYTTLAVSGNSITVGSKVTFNSGATTNTSIDSLYSTRAIISYRDDGNSGYGTSIVVGDTN